MKISKQQIEYLETRISNIINDKVKEFSKDFIAPLTNEQKLDEIYSGKASLKPRQENYFRDYLLTSFVYSNDDMLKQQEDSLKEFKNSLEKKRQEFRDKLYLSEASILELFEQEWL